MDGFLELLGNPHRSTPTIHVAGTKGKGSTAAFCDAVLAAAGYRTGFYSSPHLHSFCERIRLDTAPISQPRFASLVGELWPYQERMGRSAQLGDGLAIRRCGLDYSCLVYCRRIRMQPSNLLFPWTGKA